MRLKNFLIEVTEEEIEWYKKELEAKMDKESKDSEKSLDETFKAITKVLKKDCSNGKTGFLIG